MADDLKKKGPQDASRVNVNEDYELAYWTKRFGVTAEQLKSVAKTAGPSVNAVEQALKKSNLSR